MGPCFISTEDNGGKAPHQARPRCFNGAVLHQHGRRALSANVTRQPRASMGPCFISTEDTTQTQPRPPGAACFNGAVLHQHGRHSLRVDHPLVTTGLLQWGRASSARKTRTKHFKGKATMALQWGRASSARKTSVCVFASRLVPLASMGPCFISTEDRPEVEAAQAERDRASMGPCFISTEDLGPWFSTRIQLGGFNGAVLHQHGRPEVRAVAQRSNAAASMGPCFISTEDRTRMAPVSGCLP